MMKFYKALIFSFLLSLFSFSIADAMSLDDILPELMRKHELVKSYEDRWNAAKFSHRQAKARYYPAVDVEADVGREWIERFSGDDTDKYRAYANIKATQLLTDFGQTSNIISRSEAALKRAEIEYNNVRQNVMLEGITAYLNVIRAREQLKFARQSEASIKEQTGMEEALVKKGAGLSSDVLQAKSQLAGAMARRIKAEGDLVVAKNRFRAVFKFDLSDEDLALMQPPVMPPDMVPETLNQATVQALENNLELIMAEKDIVMAEHELGSRKATYFPTINLFSEATRREQDAGIEGWRNEALVGVEMTYNLYNGGGDTAAIRAARANLSSAVNQRKYVEDLVVERVENAWQDLITMRENARFLENQSNIIWEFLQLARKERRLGTRSLLDVLSGEIQYINATSDAVSARMDTLIATYNLIHAMGALDLDLVAAQ